MVRGGPNFHGEMVRLWKNGPPLENRFPVICMIYKDPNIEDQFQDTAVRTKHLSSVEVFMHV